MMPSIPGENIAPFHVEDLMTLVALVLARNFSQFNNRYYAQTKGFAMGPAFHGF